VVLGWWMGLVHGLAGVVMGLTVVGLPYARQCFRLARYYFYPFGVFIMERLPAGGEANQSQGSDRSVLSGPWRSVGLNTVAYALWLLVAITVIVPVTLVNLVLNWMGLVTIQMAKVEGEVLRLLFTQPLGFDFVFDYKHASHLHSLRVCVYEAFSLRYIKYRVWGMHVVWISP